MANKKFVVKLDANERTRLDDLISKGKASAIAILKARILEDLSDIQFASAARIVRVQDNLDTHVPASLYEAFEPAEARRLVERFEWHYTPQFF